MFTPNEAIAATAVVLGFIGHGYYIFSIFRGQTRPHTFT